MNPDFNRQWQAPKWAFSVLLAVLGMLGPFSIDTYLPAFAGIAQSLGATPVQMQQTLSAYLFGFAFMALFHGALSDSFGRRPVVLWGRAQQGRTIRQLPGLVLPESVVVTDDLSQTDGPETVLLALPMQVLAGFVAEQGVRLAGRRPSPS